MRRLQLAALEDDYSFKSLRRSPPSGASNVEEMANEMKQKILSVSAAVRETQDVGSLRVIKVLYYPYTSDFLP